MKKLLFLVLPIIILIPSCNTNRKNYLIHHNKYINFEYCDTINMYTDISIDNKAYCHLCIEWVLDESEIIDVLKSSELTDFIEIDARYLTLPCEYLGEAIINGKRIKYWINAGGYTTIYYNEETSFFVYRKKNDFFLEKAWVPSH